MIKHRISLPPAAHILIDEFMPACDVSEYHETTVRASIEKVYDALRTADLGGSPIVRLLLRLRALPAIFTTGGHKRNLKLNLDAIMKGGFVLLGENPPNEIALGLVGRFWTLTGTLRRVSAGEFGSFDRPGYAKAVWNFSLVEESAEVTRLATETRVRCLDDASRRRFRVYWALIAPFSGLIRREALRMIRRSSESKL
ncbi:MAG TPA: hypothetical protein VI837_11595 [Blastocatellia bacterium]|nr:hypothetical protein [Blastocatellia bacterium]